MELGLSQTEENYLKAIYSLFTTFQKPVSTNKIAEKLKTKASSVTDMIKKLADKQLVNYVKYQGASLTKEGHQVAVHVIRKHRLWEVFLVEHLDFSWDEVHEVAEQLEHVKSLKLIDQLDTFLGFPKYDPHGDPIPDREGNITDIRSTLLSALVLNDSATVVGVKDSSKDFLQYLDNAGITLGAALKVIDKLSFDKSMVIALNGKELSISNLIASNLYVKMN